MSIFKKKTEEVKDVAKKSDVVSAKKNVKASSDVKKSSYANVLVSPRITEKGSDASANGAYIFNVDPRSNKSDISKAIIEVYGVKPVKINTLTIKRKSVVIRGKKGMRAGGKKAVVYLKNGDKIEFI